MANCSIPNSIPATGRTSTPSSPQSKRPNKRQSASDFQRFSFSAFQFFLFWRVKGAWWCSRSSKPLSVRKSRGMFAACPLRNNLPLPLNLKGFPINLVLPKTIAAILRGGLEKAAEVGCAIIGGHSIRNPEPIYGLAVTGVVDLRDILANENARAGDLLVLTKPLGTGIATTAIKRGIASRTLKKKVIALMSQTNSVGAELAEKRYVRAATDITGFGLLGHLSNMCRASKVSAEIFPDRVPAIADEIFKLIKRDCIPGGTRDNLKAATTTADLKSVSPVQRAFLADAQTSGGLLLCVAESALPKVLRVLKKARTPCAAVIGRMTHGRKKLICMGK